MLTVCAEENVLQSIEIVPVKDTYNIVLSADRAVDVKKNIQAPNKVTLDMKGIRASKTLNTVYNNASNVDTVMVENTSNGLSIFFQAENAQDASITFDSIIPAATAKAAEPQKQQVKLNSPIDTYAPIYREELAQGKTSSLFDKITKKSEPMDSELEDNANDMSDTMNKIFSYGLLGLLGFAVVRLLKRKEPDMKIGLSQGLTEGLNEGANLRELNTFGNPADNYTGAEKPFTTVNYGLNAYKKENQNPYEDEPVHFHNPRLQNYVSPLLRNQQIALQRQLARSRQNTATAVTEPAIAPVRKNTTPVNKAPVNQNNPNIDNLKFLESMTAIYEKSGRHDLAQGLKTSLSKNNIKA